MGALASMLRRHITAQLEGARTAVTWQFRRGKHCWVVTLEPTVSDVNCSRHGARARTHTHLREVQELKIEFCRPQLKTKEKPCPAWELNTRGSALFADTLLMMTPFKWLWVWFYLSIRLRFRPPTCHSDGVEARETRCWDGMVRLRADEHWINTWSLLKFLFAQKLMTWVIIVSSTNRNHDYVYVFVCVHFHVSSWV